MHEELNVISTTCATTTKIILNTSTTAGTSSVSTVGTSNSSNYDDSIATSSVLNDLTGVNDGQSLPQIIFATVPANRRITTIDLNTGGTSGSEIDSTLTIPSVQLSRATTTETRINPDGTRTIYIGIPSTHALMQSAENGAQIVVASSGNSCTSDSTIGLLDRNDNSTILQTASGFVQSNTSDSDGTDHNTMNTETGARIHEVIIMTSAASDLPMHSMLTNASSTDDIVLNNATNQRGGGTVDDDLGCCTSAQIIPLQKNIVITSNRNLDTNVLNNNLSTSSATSDSLANNSGEYVDNVVEMELKEIGSFSENSDGGGGYLDNSGSSQGYNVSHLSTGSGGSGSGANGGAGGGNGNNNTGGSQGGGNSNTGDNGNGVGGIGIGTINSLNIAVAGGNNGICEQTDIKYFFEELCPVCGDKVSGYHYGLLTCESCKGFFKRTVQNKKVYTCVAERTCHIDKTQRKRCPFCRFQKCLEVGMKLEAVRADRMRGGRNKFGPMYKRDRARKLQLMRQRQLALQALRNSDGSGQSQLSPTGYQQSPYSSMNIKQEIQIPQISSLTSSPDSPPSPIAVALGQVSQNASSLGLGGSGGMSATGTCNPMVSAGSTGNTSSSGTSVQHVGNDSKMWFANSTTASPHSASPKTYNFDTGTNPTSTGDSDSITNAGRQKSFNFPRVSPMIREFVQSVDDREWQSQLFQLLQSQSYNQCEVDLFELMCKVLDQNLFSQVDWARNTVFFKDLKVEDQMKLLQNSWSDMLVLDHLHQRIHNNLPDETTLHNGQKFDLLGLGLLGVPQLSEHFNEIQKKLQELKFDVGDYICMKFLLLLNPDARGITNRNTVREGYENVQAALLDYTLTCYPSVTEKFSKLVNLIPEIHLMASEGEDHLYMKHCAGNAPTQTLLMEMLHAKRK